VTGPVRRAPGGSIGRVLFWLVFLMGAYWIPRGVQSNSDSHLALSFALVEHHTARIDPYAAKLLDKAVYCGAHTNPRTCKHYYTDKAPGLSLWVTAVYAALRPVLPPAMMPTGPKADRFLLRWLLTLLCVTAPCGAFAATFWKFCRRFAAPTTALWLVIGYSFGSMALPFSVLLFSHALSAALLFWAFMLLFSLRSPRPVSPEFGPVDDPLPTNTERTNVSISRRCILAGVFSGYAIGCEYPTVIIAGLLGLYVLLAENPTKVRIARAAAYGCGVSVGLAPAELYNVSAFHTLWAGGYAHLTDPYFAHGMAQGILGVGLPQWNAIWGTTFSPYRGLFILSPWLLLAGPGFVAMARRGLRLEAWLCGVISAAYFLFQAGYAFWDGGASVGPRHFLPALPFLVFPVLFALQEARSRRIGQSLICFSVVQLVLIVMTNPLYGDPRYVQNVMLPFFDQTLHDLAIGRLQNNWGMVFALPSYASLIPLVFLVYLGVRRLRIHLDFLQAKADIA
jgi:hypothetical protein